jgi:hypothetical protein
MKQGRHLKGRWGISQTGVMSREGTVEQWEHWDGSVDADVRLRPFRMRLKPENADDPKVLRLIHELEQAIRANETALRSKDRLVHKRTAARVEDVKRRLAERVG